MVGWWLGWQQVACNTETDGCRVGWVALGVSHLRAAHALHQMATGDKVFDFVPPCESHHHSQVKHTVTGTLALLRANHPEDCMSCDVNGKCEFQDLITRYKASSRGGAHDEGLRRPPLLCPCLPHPHSLTQS